MQSKLESFIESLLNTIIGYLIALVTQIIFYPMFGIHVEFHDQLSLALLFTCVSLVRSYVIRRYFNSHFKSTVAYIVDKVQTLKGKSNV